MTDYANRVIDARTTRGIVLAVLRAYADPGKKSEKEIEGVLPLLQHCPRPEVRATAAHASRMWMGTFHRDPVRHRRLIFYRLRRLDAALEELERLTRPKQKKAR